MEDRNTSTPTSHESSRRFYPYIAIPAALLVFALVTRLYDLSTFPLFSVGYPSCGGLPDCTGAYTALPGLYDDEVTNVLASQSIHGIVSNFGGGPVAALLVLISTRALGFTIFAVRFPFALVSSITAVLVYFTTREITGGRISAILSSIYFIVMVPALIYGRLALAENIVALLFLICVYATLKISRSSNAQSQRFWFLLLALSAAIATLVKFDGIILIVYFLVYVFRAKLLGRAFPYVVLSLVLGVFAPLAAIQLVTGKAVSSVTTGLLPFVTEMGNQLAMFRYFFLNTYPSGAIITLGNYFAPEFWYIFLYLALFALMIYNYREYSDILLAIGVFVAFFATFSAAFGSYWMIIIQPLLAIAFGPGLKRLLQMPFVAALAVYAFLFVPLATIIGEYLITPRQFGHNPIVNNELFYWNLGVVIPLAALLFFTARMHQTSTRWRMWVNGTLIVAFFVALGIGSFLVPGLSL
jgi:Dolichyl-phosphate-mannose-protein mannosyltransferase